MNKERVIQICLTAVKSEFKLDEQSKFSVKLEHTGFIIGETPRVTTNEHNELVFNHTFKYNYNVKEIRLIEALFSRPFILTVLEQKTQEKKHKELKIEVFGQVSFDCVHFIKNELENCLTLNLNLFGPSTKKEIASLEIKTSIDKPIFAADEMDNLNLLCVKIRSLQNAPFSEHLKDHVELVGVMPVPTDLNKSESLLLSTKGFTKYPTDIGYSDISDKWPDSSGSTEIIHSSLFDVTASARKEAGDYPYNEFKLFRSVAENEKPKVIWNHQHRCILNDTAQNNFKENISCAKFWPLEIFTFNSSNSGKKKKEDEQIYGYHGVAYLDLSYLLYPGVQSIHGAYRVYPYVETEYEEKTKRRSSCLTEALNNLAKIYPTTTAQTTQKKPQLTTPKPDRKLSVAQGKLTTRSGTGLFESDQERKDLESGKSILTPIPLQEPINEHSNLEAQQYLDSQSFVVIEISFEKPLIPKRTLDEIDQIVCNYIMKRKPLPKRHTTAEKAVKEYNQQIAEVVNCLLLDFKSMFADLIQTEQLPIDHEYMEQMKQELFYSLNSSGKYFALKERLKFAVVKVVRERFFRSTPFDNEEQLQVFLRDLFIYLVDEMHISLTNIFKPKEYVSSIDQKEHNDSETLLRYAREAEQNGLHDWAIKYYEERITRDPSCPLKWIDFGVYYLKRNEIEQAEVCFYRSLLIDAKQIIALILFGLVCAMQNRTEEAADFLEAAVAHDLKNPIVWTILGIFYQTVSNDVGVEMAFDEAKRLSEIDDQNEKSQVLNQNVENSFTSTISQKILHEEEIQKIISTDDYANKKNLVNDLNLENHFTTDGNSLDQNQSDERQSNDGKSRKQTALSQKSRSPKSTNKIISDLHSDRDVSNVYEKPKTTSLFLKTAEFLLDHNLYAFASTALAHELVYQKKEFESHLRTDYQTVTVSNSVPNLSTSDYRTPNQSNLNSLLSGTTLSTLTGQFSSAHSIIKRLQKYHLCCAHLAMSPIRNDLTDAEFNISVIIETDPECCEAWSCLGHLRYIVEDFNAARACYERCLALVTWPPHDPHLLLSRLGTIYLKDKKYQEAKDTFLRTCKISPTCSTWLGVGKACYRLGEFENCEDALTEANFLNNRNPEVWAYLSLVCLKTGRKTEAEQSYKYAVKMELNDSDLFDELHSLQKKVGFGNPLVYQSITT